MPDLRCKVWSYLNAGIASIIQYIHILLARVPALSCRLGRVPCDGAFGALAGGCAPCDRAIVHSLSIAKKFD